MYRANVSLEQTESNQRDLIITALKKELYILQDREHEYSALSDEVSNC
jgi:hypothetical protein